MLVTTDAFAELARSGATQAGLHRARIVAVPHPIGGVKPDLLAARADAAVEEVVNRLLGREAALNR